MVKNSKLTWLMLDCLDAVKAFQYAVKEQASFGDISEKTAKLSADLVIANSALTGVVTAYTNARAELVRLQALMNAETVSSKRTALSKELSELASAVLRLSLSKSTLSERVRDLESQNATILSAPATFKSSIAQAKSNANLLCKKGL
jgi:chromosome segregation ATPase